LLDRIDIHLEVPALVCRELSPSVEDEPSAVIRARVERARVLQRERFRGHRGVYANAHMGAREIRRYCRVGEPVEALLRSAVERLGLSARAYHRVLKIARTIADLEGVDELTASHVSEAIQYSKFGPAEGCCVTLASRMKPSGRGGTRRAALWRAA
jgi:magnesium chelatase family protein